MRVWTVRGVTKVAHNGCEPGELFPSRLPVEKRHLRACVPVRFARGCTCGCGQGEGSKGCS